MSPKQRYTLIGAVAVIAVIAVYVLFLRGDDELADDDFVARDDVPISKVYDDVDAACAALAKEAPEKWSNNETKAKADLAEVQAALRDNSSVRLTALTECEGRPAVAVGVSTPSVNIPAIASGGTRVLVYRQPKIEAL